MRRAADRGFWVPLLLAAVSAVFFWKVLFLGRAIGGLDVIDYFAPYRQYAQQAIDSGQLPLWNPDIFGGVPFLANIQSALFYPPTGLFYVLDEPWAYTANLVIHAFLAALFTYLFLRQSVHLGRCGALSGAIIFAFGGFMGGQSGHLNQFSAATWLPALLLCWDKAAARRLGYVLLGGLVVTLQFLAGHSQESYLMLVAMAFYAASTTILDIRREGWAHLPVRGLTFVVMLALGGGLAAIQLVPTSELTSWSIRANGLSYADATTFSLKPTMLLEALLPPFANRALLLEPGGTEFLGYAGAVGLVLAAAGLVYGRRRHAMIFGLLAAGAVLLAFGKENPAFPLLFKIVPGFNLFRVPARWLFLASFGVAVLAGAGADALGGVAPARDWRPLAIILGGCGALAAAMSWSQALPPRTTTAFWIVFGLLGVLVAFFALTLNRRRSPAVTPRRPPPGWSPQLTLSALTVGLVIVELWVAAQSLDYNHPTLPNLFDQPLPTLQFLQSQPGPFRVLSVAQDTFAPAAEPAIRQDFGTVLPDRDMFEYLAGYKLREIVEPNTGLAAGLASIDGYDGGLLPLARYVAFKDALTGLPSAPDDRIRFVVKWPPNRPLLNLAGVRYLLADGLHDKTVDGVSYDLSGVIHAIPGQAPVTITLPTPAPARSIGVVSASRGDQASLVVTDDLGHTQTIPIPTGGEPVGDMPWSEQVAGSSAVIPLPSTINVASIGFVAGSQDAFLNGLALIDPGGAKAFSPLVAPGRAMSPVYKGDVKIYQNTTALGPAFLVHQAQLASGAEQAIADIRSSTFDPATSVVIEGSPAPPPSTSLLGRVSNRLKRLLPGAQPAPFTIPDSWLQETAPAAGQSPDQLALRVFSAGHAVISTQSAGPSFLVLTQSYYPGWTVSIDGASQPLLGADGLFQAVHLTAGIHQVEFSYQPRSVTLGTLLTAVAAAVWLVGLGMLVVSRLAAPRRRA